MMLWKTTALVATLLATGTQAGTGLRELVAEGLTRGNPSVERRMQEIAKATLLARGFLETRQTVGGVSNAPRAPDGSIDMRAWNDMANEACIEALRKLRNPTNPSGTCVCYNLPLLNRTTGSFNADLRLYRLGQPTGEFSGIPAEQIMVSLSYQGSTVSLTPNTATGLDDESDSEDNTTNGIETRGLEQRQSNDTDDLELLQSYLFVGQIDNSRMPKPDEVGALQALVMPIVTLSGTNAQGQTVSTNVSSSEAAFVAGEFSTEVIQSLFVQAEVAVENEVAKLKKLETAFVLPGVQILIFPVGLIITSLWLILGLIAYGIGTYDRVMWANRHRRNVAINSKPRSARI